MLCIGDSNTYGLWLEREEAYPARLALRWNAGPQATPVEVLNLGVPGANTSRVLRNLSPVVDATRPDVVLLMLGVNDYWTRPVPLDATDEAPQRSQAEPWLLRHSILYELLRLAWRSRDPRAGEVEVTVREGKKQERRAAGHALRLGDVELDAGFEEGLDPSERGDSDALLANLEEIASRLRARGVALYLLTYPARSDFYALANRQVRLAARESGVPLVDFEPLFARRCASSACPDWFFSDHHPTARGYDLMARVLVQRLRRDGW